MILPPQKNNYTTLDSFSPLKNQTNEIVRMPCKSNLNISQGGTKYLPKHTYLSTPTSKFNIRSSIVGMYVLTTNQNNRFLYQGYYIL